MTITPTTNWNNIQRRAVDPYSLYTSENINFLNAIIGKDRARIVGLNAEYLYDVPTGNLFIHLSAGVCIKDYVLISFNDDVYVSVGTWPVSAGAYLIVVDYKFETKYPPNIARISVINESAYDASQHMVLYRLTVSGITYPGSLYLETVEELTNFDRSAEEAISMLQDHITNNSAHTHLFYTKQQIDNMLLSQTIDPETLAALLNSLLPIQLDADGDLIFANMYHIGPNLGFFDTIPVAKTSVTLTNTDNEIGGLTFNATTYTGSEIEALRDKCEALADDVRALHAALASYGLI